MQQITRGDYLKDLITIYVDNNLQTSLTDLYTSFIFQCGDIQKFLTPAQVIKISFNEQESQLLKTSNTCYLAGITADGHKETFNGSLTFNTRGEVVFYEPPISTVIPASTTTTECGCRGLTGVFANCSQPAIKAYFTLNYVPTKLSELINDTDFVDSVDVAEDISIHNSSTEAHLYIQELIETETSIRASETEALSGSIQAEATAREEAVSLAISTTEGYADSAVSVHNSDTEAHPFILTTIGDLDNLDTSVKSSVVNAINSEVSARESADNNLQGQIDGLAAASDVTDIVGTYQELENYDTQHLNDNDIIKVLSDSTHDNQPSYYRYDKDTDTFSYIGSESAAYTKAQSDSIFVTKTTEINGHALSSDINLTASDVGALPSTTTIGNGATTIQRNGTAIGTITANQTVANTINVTVPTAVSQITNDSNFQTAAQVTSAISSATSSLANQDLSNLSATGEARLHALKSYADNGELLTDSEGLADVKSYAHSTFCGYQPSNASPLDPKKFVKVGSPIITDDGIASGFSSSNKITFTNPITSGSKFEIITKVKIPSTTGSQYILSTPQMGFILGLSHAPSTRRLQLYLSSNGTSWDIADVVGNIVYTVGKEYYFKVKFTGTQYIFSYSEDGINYTVDKTINSTSSIYQRSTLQIGGWNNDGAFQGSIDLKQFSITVDGEEVFSGNKTGIDTIKPDDFIAGESVNISDDGILTGSYNAATGVSKTVLSSSFNKAVVTFRLKKIADPTDLSGNNVLIKITPNIFLYASFGGTGTGLLWYGSFYEALYTGDNKLAIGDVVDCVMTIDNTQSTKIVYLDIYINGTLDKQTFQTLASAVSNLTFYSYANDLSLNNNAWELDLNSITYTVDGNLVYQPCLKIPYTESKTGSKIVDAVYRDRVNDMAEQFGYANYYTLSDADFTLPQVELYGLIGQRTLRDSYRNGINYWELYSNRDLEQGGSCTSGVEVTFARPFADTNYVLSVPYSAKSATAFTPTQTGDWIAKGKGIL